MGGTLDGPNRPEGPWSPPGEVTWGGPGLPPPPPDRTWRPGQPQGQSQSQGQGQGPPRFFTQSPQPPQAPGMAPYGPQQPGWPGLPPPGGPGKPQPGGTRVGKGWLVLAGIAGVLVLVLVIGLLALVLGGADDPRFDDSRSREARIAREGLHAAATNLTQNPGVRYTGSFRDDTGDTVNVEARMTNEGWTRATLTRDGDKVSVLSNGPHSYLKAGKTYWSHHGAPRDSLDEYAKRWVRVPTDELGIDLARSLSPGVLGADLLLAVERGEVRVGPVTRLNGVEVREVTTRYATVYLTTVTPQQVVRVIARKPSSASPGGQGGGELVPATRGHTPHLTRARTPIDPEEFQFDLVSLSPDELKSLFKELEKRVGELKKSVDSEVRFSLDSAIRLNPCHVTGCTATLSMANSVTSTSPYLAAKRSVVASITIRMTLDKRPVKTCTTTRRMKPNGSATVKCHAGYTVPADGRTHHVEAIARAVARATVEADIKRMFDDLKAERERGAPQPPGADGDLGPKWQPCDPSAIPESSNCRKAGEKITRQIGGEIHTITPPSGAQTLGEYRGYDSRWNDHVVVVKSGRVYDAWTGRHGEPIDVYKARWGSGDVLKFDF